jgi:hypothetical protein
MRIVRLFILCALVLVWGVFCARETIFTLSDARSENVIVAEDLDTMRKVIEAAATRTYQNLPLVDLIAKRKVFLVQSGTRVEVKEAHLFGRNARVEILEGEHAGRLGWVQKSMLR